MDALAPSVYVLRRTPDRRRAEAFALGLDSAAIASTVELHDREWWVVVAPADATAGERALDGFDAEVNALAVAVLPQQPQPLSLLGPAVALGLLIFYLVTGQVDLDSRWFQRGGALSVRLLHGEAYRAVTALTLHAHFAHVLGNAAVAFVLLGALGRALGPGVALLLTVGSGALGNFATAAWYGAGHASIGASTAVFGALGLISAPGAWRRASRWPRWVALGASLALLGMLGTGPQADVVAHLAGWASGLGLGIGVAVLYPTRRPAVDVICGGLALGAIAGAWWLALR